MPTSHLSTLFMCTDALPWIAIIKFKKTNQPVSSLDNLLLRQLQEFFFLNLTGFPFHCQHNCWSRLAAINKQNKLQPHLLQGNNVKLTR